MRDDLNEWHNVVITCEARRPMMDWRHPCENPEMKALEVMALMRTHFREGSETAALAQIEARQHAEAVRHAHARGRVEPEPSQLTRRWHAFGRLIEDLAAKERKAGFMPAKFDLEKDVDFWGARTPEKVVARQEYGNWRPGGYRRRDRGRER